MRVVLNRYGTLNSRNYYLSLFVSLRFKYRSSSVRFFTLLLSAFASRTALPTRTVRLFGGLSFRDRTPPDGRFSHDPPTSESEARSNGFRAILGWKNGRALKKINRRPRVARKISPFERIATTTAVPGRTTASNPTETELSISVRDFFG